MTQHPITAALAPLVIIVAGTGAAVAACTPAPDVLPVPAPSAQAAKVTYLGTTAQGAAWMVSGLINRCTDGDTRLIELRTSPDLGLTVSASAAVSITGVTIRFGNEAIESLPTEWRLTGPATISVLDAANQDRSNNRLTLAWSGAFQNLTDYQLSYTLFLIQK